MFSAVRARLTLWYTVVLAVVLVTFSGISYVLLAREIRGSTDALLAGTAHELTGAFIDDPSHTARGAEVLLDFRYSDRAIMVFSTDGRLAPGQLQLQPLDGGRWRGPLEPGVEKSLDRLGVRGRLGEALLDDELAGRPWHGKREIEGQPEMGPGRGHPPGGDLIGKGRGQPMEDEPERFGLGDRWVDRQGEDEALRGATRPEWLQLLAASPGVKAFSLLTEPGDERRARQVRHRSDPAQAEPGETGSDVRIG